jgi:hypothetical protein
LHVHGVDVHARARLGRVSGGACGDAGGGEVMPPPGSR